MEESKIKLSIIIPCYNEEKNISLILNKFNEVIKTNEIEVILVNNGSLDNSEAVFAELVPNYNFARVVKVEINQGYGYGITSGLREAKSDFIGYTHADMQTDPADVIKAFDIIKNATNPKNTYVKGDRKKRKFLDQFFTTGMSIFETIYLRTSLWDINAQPNVFHRSFFENLENIPKDFSLDLYLLYMARRKGLDVIRIDVFFPPRIHGESSWNTGLASKWKFIKRTMDFSVKLKKEL
ncbi:glycosyltransferase family 2 protein [Flavobacterium phragmitis]|uniref:Glycosyl transferase family 2 n=1 Tax=Flavobacterium phragmitis TaxID=739143 RepID=A0A1I1UR45_9FLAO|nr:glycosyltransferase family 2 protein [Flavobacterium phragmitis]SFD73256.1 Glycosyl transferase family 2 [Flavobacterium phragmitis]